MKGKSKVSPEEVNLSSDSSDSEDTGPFKFLHIKRRKLDKEISIWIREPEKFYIEHRYTTDMAYIVYMEIAKDGQRQGQFTSTRTDKSGNAGLTSRSTNIPVNFLLKGTIFQKSSVALNRRYPPHIGQNDAQPGLPAVVKRVPGSIDLHATNQPSGRSRGKELKSHRGCSVS